MKFLIRILILLAGLALALAIVLPLTENFSNFNIDSLTQNAEEILGSIKGG